MPASQANTMLRDRCLAVPGTRAGERRGGDRLLALHVLHLGGGVAEVAVLAAVQLQQERADQERDQSGAEDTHGDAEEVAAGRLRVDREDRAGCGWRAQPDVEQHHQEDAGHAAGDGGQDHLGLHQHVGEVDLVDAAEELDDRRARGGRLGQAAPEERVGQQQAQPGTGVGLEQEQHRLALLGGLLDAERGQHAVVDGVVEEEHLGRLDEDRGQREQPVVDQEVDGVTEPLGDLAQDRREQEHADRPPSARARMPAEKLLTSISKPGLILWLQSASSFFITRALERAHDHGAQEHRGRAVVADEDRVAGGHDDADDRERRRRRRRGRRRRSCRRCRRSGSGAGR